MSKTIWIITAGIIILIALGTIVLVGMNNSNNLPVQSSGGSGQSLAGNGNSGGENNVTTGVSSGPTSAPQPQAYNVQIKGFAFSPETLTINKGDSVVWTNMDSAPHTVVSDSGSEISSQSLSTGQSYSHTFSNAGTYAYHCSIHPSMKATIIVQ